MTTGLNSGLNLGELRTIHHFALNVNNLEASRHFYGQILGLQELTGDNLPETLVKLVAAGKVASFKTADGTILDLFAEPELSPPMPILANNLPGQVILAFDIAPHSFDGALEVLERHGVIIDHGPVSRPTGRGIYFYDPDGFMVEIRCDAIAEE
ncbi:MAG: VOC family protein [Synechococcaceae cyanobacterium RL_1_2]|nr:VOC family protein [Synechococcaceae cyanobacterium RL_1_2]